MLAFVQQLSVATRIILILSVLVLVGGFLALDALTGFNPEPYLQLLILILGAYGAGVATASGPQRPSGGATAGLIVLVLVGAQGCAPCVAEQAVVSALDVGLSAADEAVGDDAGEEWSQALEIAQGVTMLGAAAVDGCELARDSAGWQQWVGLALETAMGIAAHFGGAGTGDIPENPPTELTSAISMLQGEIE